MINLKNIIATMTNEIYVADHCLRIERRFRNNPKAQLDSLWRIASSVDLFEKLGNHLTPEQEEITWKFLTAFKLSPKGKEALKTVSKYARWSRTA